MAHVVSIREEVVATPETAEVRQQRQERLRRRLSGAAPAEPEVAKKGKQPSAKKPRGEEVSLGGSKRVRQPRRASKRSAGGKPSPTPDAGPFLVVGLGNPGLEYLWTPHNAGFMAIDRIAQQEGVVVQNRRCRATTATCRIAGRQVVLAKPETFMNLSGAAVAALVRGV